MACIFSIDVEDWFHILDTPAAPQIDQWAAMPSRVERNFLRLLDLFAEKRARTTCFFLGWVAKRFPRLVKEARQRGHEIASHGYSHQLVYKLTREQFLEDATTSKAILEDTVGHSIDGYRSSGFSVTKETPWFFDVLIAAGYRYDSSVFPAPHSHGGLRTNRYCPYLVGSPPKQLIEFPISVAKVMGRPMCFFGGGYLRLFPYGVIKRMTLRVLEEGRPVVFYIHPREIDPHHPRLPMSLPRRFKSYVNLETTEGKLTSLLDQFESMTFDDYIARHFEDVRSSQCQPVP